MMRVSKVSFDIHDVMIAPLLRSSRNSKKIRDPLCELLVFAASRTGQIMKLKGMVPVWIIHVNTEIFSVKSG